MKGISEQPTIVSLACSYLKNNSKMSYSHPNYKINNFYKDVAAHLLDETKPSLEESLNKNTKFEYIFLPLVEKFQERQQQEFLCSRAFQVSEDQFVQVFKCYECGLQQNSICCVQCFEFSKHKDHHYQLVDIKGGCCDCGDDSKWDQKGFCSKHTISGELDQSQNEVQKELFQSFCQHAFTILCKFYEAYKSKEIQILKLSLQKMDDQKGKIQKIQNQRKISEYILKIVDVFGYNFVKNLVNINKNRYEVNQMTRQWLEKTLKFQQKMKFVPSIPNQELILRFSQLTHMGKATVELYVILCNRAQRFRREVTISYFRLLSQLPTYIKSTYSDFSPQLFSSSNLILELIQTKKIKPLNFRRSIPASCSFQNLQNEIKLINDDYKHFFRDINYLIELKDQAFKAYWNYFSDQYGFQAIMTYEELFNENQQHLKIAHRSSFFLQELSLLQLIKIIDKMDGDEEFIIVNLKRLTLRLFQRYSSNAQLRFMKDNLFFTDERMWTIFLFAYFYCCKKNQNFFEEQFDIKITELLRIINSPQFGPSELNQKLASFKIDKHSLSALMEHLMKELLRRFYQMSHIMKNNLMIKQHMSFAMTYYKSTNLIYSVDAFLFKFSLKLWDKKYLIRQINDYFIKFNEQFQRNFQRFHMNRRSQQQRKIVIAQFQNLILCFHNFLNLISEAIYFTYHELVILSRFKNLLKNNLHGDKFLSFYANILDIWVEKDRKESLSQFKASFQHLFFKEDHFFQMFVNNYDERQAKKARNSKQQAINLEYFYILRFKFNSNDYLSKFIRKISFGYVPFNVKSNYGTHIIPQTDHLKLMASWLQESMKIPQFQKHLINDLTKELYKIQALSKSHAYHSYFTSHFVKLFSQSPQHNNSMEKLSVFSFLNQDIKRDLKNFKNQQNIVQASSQLNSSSLQSSSRSFSQQRRQQEYYHSDISQRSQNNLNSQRQFNKQKEALRFEVTLGVEIERSCMLGADCRFKNQLSYSLYQICFISLTNMYGAFSIEKSQNIISFSTCGHLIHRACYQKQLGSSSSGRILRCKRCKKNYNFILSSFQYLAKTEEQKKMELVKEDLKNITLFLQPRLQSRKSFKSIEFEIFKAIVAFLLCNIVIDDFNILRKNFQLYRNLFKKLKFLVEKQPRNFRSSNQKGIRIPRQSVFIELIDFVTERLAYQFGFSSFRDIQQQLKKCQKYQKQFNYIVSIITFFNSETKRWTIKEPSEYFLEQPIQKINLPSFSSSLGDLHQKRQCWKCSSKQRHSYYICLSHSSSLKENSQYCVCFVCVNSWVAQHLKTEMDHMNEALMLRTDTGQIYYFFIDKSQTKGLLMFHILDSIYLNNMMNVYEVGKKYKVKDFSLNKERVKNVINGLRSWSYVLSASPV